jgi:hypothetical protein
MPHPGHFTPQKETQYPLTGGLVGLGQFVHTLKFYVKLYFEMTNNSMKHIKIWCHQKLATLSLWICEFFFQGNQVDIEDTLTTDYSVFLDRRFTFEVQPESP